MSIYLKLIISIFKQKLLFSWDILLKFSCFGLLYIILVIFNMNWNLNFYKTSRLFFNVQNCSYSPPSPERGLKGFSSTRKLNYWKHSYFKLSFSIRAKHNLKVCLWNLENSIRLLYTYVIKKLLKFLLICFY